MCSVARCSEKGACTIRHGGLYRHRLEAACQFSNHRLCRGSMQASREKASSRSQRSRSDAGERLPSVRLLRVKSGPRKRVDPHSAPRRTGSTKCLAIHLARELAPRGLAPKGHGGAERRMLMAGLRREHVAPPRAICGVLRAAARAECDAHFSLSASSWRDLVVDPGGAPAPTERPLCVRRARRHRHPVLQHERLEKRPSVGRGGRSVCEPEPPGISFADLARRLISRA